LPAFTTLPIDPLTGAIGRRPSGAPLYHRGSQFGPPERRKLDRNMRVRLLYLAKALDQRTRQKGQHGGMLKRTGIEVLRQLLFTFLNMQTGACFPSHEQIARAAGCCIETVRKAIRALEAAGIVQTIRRKIVATFTSRQHRARYDVAVQDSNSYVFNVALSDWPTEGDLASPLFRPPSEADARNRYETNHNLKTKLPADLANALAELGRLIDTREKREAEAQLVAEGAIRHLPRRSTRSMPGVTLRPRLTRSTQS
jgi:hypothetical protein